MLKCGNMQPCDTPMKEKIVYEGYMQMQVKYGNSPFLKDNTIMQSARSQNTEKFEEELVPEVVASKKRFEDNLQKSIQDKKQSVKDFKEKLSEPLSKVAEGTSQKLREVKEKVQEKSKMVSDKLEEVKIELPSV